MEDNKLNVLVSVYDLSLLVQTVSKLSECVKQQQESIDRLTKEIYRIKQEQNNNKGNKSWLASILKPFQR